jgi:hypothetical protein
MYPPNYGQMMGSNNPNTNPYYPYMVPGYMPHQPQPHPSSSKSKPSSKESPDFEKNSKNISNEEVMSSIMELKNFIFDSNSRVKQKRDDSSSDSYHRYKRREKYKRRSRKREPTPSEDEGKSDDGSPVFSFNNAK